jgi:ketopantoate hydroxymethyltransferase
MKDMLYHTQAVAQATSQALLISDMPYQSYTSAKQTLENAKYLMQAGAQMVKFEGGREHESAFKTKLGLWLVPLLACDKAYPSYSHLMCFHPP